MPQAERKGFIPTLNNQGYMLSSLDVYTQAFVDFSASCALPVMDIGAAYGLTTLPALQKGAKVIAVDLDLRHLDILRQRAGQDAARLETLCGAFPEEIDAADASLGAALAARVLHFLTPEQLEQAAGKLYRWLAPNGKVFITAETPYLSNWETFIPVYEKRKAEGDPWPGLVEDVMRYVPERGKNLPPQMLFLDPGTLKRVFSAAGFIVETVDFIPRPDFPDDLRRDGRESVGLIARK